MSSDHRSVGELLVANDLIARGILMDTEQLHARELIRGWAAMVEAADKFWTALPNADNAAGAALDLSIMAIRSTRQDGAWQKGPQDQRLADMTANLTRATELLRRHDRVEGAPLSPAVVSDLEATRTRVLHSLHLAAHGVGVALLNEQRVLADPEIQRSLPNREGMTVMVDRLRQRFSGVEQSLQLHLHGRWPSHLEGEHRERPDEHRLHESMASFDVQARRALSDPTPASIYLTCRAQAAIIGNGHALLRAAALNEIIDPLEYRDRLAPALKTVTGRLRAASDVWRNMVVREDGLDPDLRDVAREAMTAVSELVRDGAVLASVETLQDRVDLREVAPLMQQALITAADTAHSVQEAARVADLTGPARWVNDAAAKAQARLYAANVEPSPMKAWVSPNALLRNEHVPIPNVLRDHLAGQMGRVVSATASVREAAANVLDRGPRLEGRAAQDQALPQMGGHHSPTVVPG